MNSINVDQTTGVIADDRIKGLEPHSGILMNKEW